MPLQSGVPYTHGISSTIIKHTLESVHEAGVGNRKPRFEIDRLVAQIGQDGWDNQPNVISTGGIDL